ncbi:hypothetical protein ABT56_17390 [Photobacterium aquae]|uniref:Restriction endonuclease type IV Mrr domain-containing protein n=1 Tax=Photobacterium aquae TaxID=1195763 RepID=A0A0J1JNP7_9GAMM|nr:restriction endonuclease [Photobacterium aquae]KLV03852.1 hypothetical protein ABT56_17390 [Photobacterium aquae]
MTTPLYTLVRSSRALMDTGEIGYGWSQIDFSKYPDANSLIEQGFIKNNIDFGRKRKQIMRYRSLKAGDRVVVPMSGTIVIAEVIGVRRHVLGSDVVYSENRISVRYFTDAKGSAFIPRTALTTKLQSRLRLRASIGVLDDFAEEIEKQIAGLNQGEIHTWKHEVEARQFQQETQFKTELLKRLQSGSDIALKAGGDGLEQLIRNLLEANGYNARILPKRQSSGIDDVDIAAHKTNDLTSDLEGLYIQIKHHRGHTGLHAVRQLDAFEDEGEEIRFCRKVLITTASLEREVLEEAERCGIATLDGIQLVDWIYQQRDKLNERDRAVLGISNVPQLI